MIEFKKDKPSQVALDQIKEMEYQEQYRVWKEEEPQRKKVLHVFLGDEPLTEGQEIPSGSYEAAVSASSPWPK